MEFFHITCKTFWHYLLMLTIRRACNPAIPALGIHPRDTLAHMPQETYTGMFVITPKRVKGK